MSRIEDEVAAEIVKRAEAGLAKYGHTMEREDLSIVEWLQHAKEEAMDLAVYLQRLIEIMEKL
jgi:nucleotide-binding universal stress UspA family protein